MRFRYKDYSDGRQHKAMTLDAGEFLRRFVQHVLPKGFVKIRHYGLLVGAQREARLALCRRLLLVATVAAAVTETQAVSLVVSCSVERAADTPKGADRDKAAAAQDDTRLEFEQIVWVQNKAPQLSLLYLLVPEPAKGPDEADKLVLRYAPAALQEAERITGPGEGKRPRFKGEFNVVFVIASGKDEKLAMSTGFGVEQLQKYTSLSQEKALQAIEAHTWGFQKLPLINPGP